MPGLGGKKKPERGPFDPPLLPSELERFKQHREKRRCPECKRVALGNHPPHWPSCSKAEPEERERWEKRKKLREMRSARRIGE
jgi:hypothetical protein